MHISLARVYISPKWAFKLLSLVANKIVLIIMLIKMIIIIIILTFILIIIIIIIRI